VETDPNLRHKILFVGADRPTGRKPGGQFGHPGHVKVPYSENKVTENINLFPEECLGCRGKIFEESVTSVFDWWSTTSSKESYATGLTWTSPSKLTFLTKEPLENLRPLHNFSWSASLTTKLCNISEIEKKNNISKSFVMNIL